MLWMILFLVVLGCFAAYIMLDRYKKRKIVDQLCDQAEELETTLRDKLQTATSKEALHLTLQAMYFSGCVNAIAAAFEHPFKAGRIPSYSEYVADSALKVMEISVKPNIENN